MRISRVTIHCSGPESFNLYVSGMLLHNTPIWLISLYLQLENWSSKVNNMPLPIHPVEWRRLNLNPLWQASELALNRYLIKAYNAFIIGNVIKVAKHSLSGKSAAAQESGPETYLSQLPARVALASRAWAEWQGRAARQQARGAQQCQPHSCLLALTGHLVFCAGGWRNLYGFLTLNVKTGDSFECFLCLERLTEPWKACYLSLMTTRKYYALIGRKHSMDLSFKGFFFPLVFYINLTHEKTYFLCQNQIAIVFSLI